MQIVSISNTLRTNQDEPTLDGPRIDAAVLDLKLGEEDATPLMEEFARRNIPFLVTTGLDASVPAGVRILPKPYRDAEFIDAILELVHRKQ